MKNRALLILSLLALTCALPATATDFSIFGSYWDTDVAGNVAGGGVGLAFPFNDSWGLELRGTYYEELTDDPIANAFDSDDPVFEEQGIQAIPVDVGLRWKFPGESVRPYVSGGGTYYLLDSDFGEVSDEVGYYATLGADFGRREGLSFFVEATYRNVEGTVELDPEDLDDIDDIDVTDSANFELDGFGANAGLRWSF